MNIVYQRITNKWDKIVDGGPELTLHLPSLSYILVDVNVQGAENDYAYSIVDDTNMQILKMWTYIYQY